MEQFLHINKDKDRDVHRRDKRNSLNINAKRASSGSRDRVQAQSSPRHSSPQITLHLPAKMEAVIESPPLVFYGNTTNSTGALLSGRIKLNVLDPEVTLRRFEMSLQAVVTVKKPVEKNCPQCQTQRNDIKTWEFITEPVKLTQGLHQYPFSHLLPGHLPATTQAYLGTLEYQLNARAITSLNEPVSFTLPLNIQRAIIPGNDKTSVRIFPPTNITARVVLPPVIHPIGAFPVNMVLNGILEKGKDAQTRWKLRKMTWRLEEHQKVVSPACTKHAGKVGGEGKGIQHTNVRNIAQDELKSGWKSDWDTEGGEIALEFNAAVNPASQPVCDVDSPAGMEVTHNLVIELIVAEEYCPNKNTRLVTPTGAARVLRMQFKMFATERTGLGISWDEEMPPVYSDVPASPPDYHNTTIEDYGGPPLEYEELDRLDRHSPRRDRSGSGTSAGGTVRTNTSHASSPLQRPVRMPALNVDDLETAPVFRERRPDAMPADPEDRST
jgi:arrestin-related trafficking adapter 1